MRINDHGIGKDLDRMGKIDLSKPLLQAALVVAEDVKKNTQQGKAPTGARFKKYSDSYKDTIRRAKRQKNPNLPNLTWTGGMMKSIVARLVSKTRALVKPLGARDGLLFSRLMEYNIANGRDPMGISKTAHKKIKQIFDKVLGKL